MAIRVIREGAQRASVDNSGGVIFVYDEANAKEIIERNPFILTGFTAEEESDSLLRQMAEEGLLIVYELFQDNPTEIDIAVGPPLTSAELSLAAWHEPQRAFLSCPSGELHIASHDSLRIAPEARAYPDNLAAEEAVINVPPGGYMLTLYRVDWDQLANRGVFWIQEDWREEPFEPYDGPFELITLTPAPDDYQGKGFPPILWYPR